MAGPTCSIIIPVFNGRFYTQLCLDTLRRTAAGEPPSEVIVVDNGSTDGTASLLTEFGDVVTHIIRNEANLGFAAANNQAARMASGQFLVLLNNDVLVEPGWLRNLVAAAQAPDVGVVGARLLYPDDTIQHAGMVFPLSLNPHHIYRGYPGDWPEALVPKDYQAVTGACLLIARDLFEAMGGLDETFHNAFEDVDLCLKVRRAGKRVVYCPEATAHHFESSTAGRMLRDESNLKLFHERWDDSLAADAEDPALAGLAMLGPASIMRLGSASLAAENEQLRALVCGSARLSALGHHTSAPPLARSRQFDLVYRPARPRSTIAGAVTKVPVVVENHGNKGWGPSSLRIGYHWQKVGAPEYMLWDGLGAVVEQAVEPGYTVIVSAAITMPTVPGEYVLEWDALEDRVAWMSELGVIPFRQLVTVEEDPGVSIAVEGLPTTLLLGQAAKVTLHLLGETGDWRRRTSHILCCWLTPDGRVITEAEPVSVEHSLDADGDQSRLPIRARAPRQAGEYSLQIQEWVVARGWVALSTEGGGVYVVAKAPESEIVAGPRSFHGDFCSDKASVACDLDQPTDWQARAEELDYLLARAQRDMEQPRDVNAKIRFIDRCRKVRVLRWPFLVGRLALRRPRRASPARG
ncbi:MAG: glycosyltransferase family 2 protein [Chloroflexota bacterium]